MSYYDDYGSQREHDMLIDEIKPYWLGRGWRLSTLESKSTRELLGIRITMYKQLAKDRQKPIITATQKQKSVVAVINQGNLFDHVVDTKIEKPVKTSPIRKNKYRQIILLGEED